MTTIDNIMEAQEYFLEHLTYINGELYWKQNAKSFFMRGKKAGSIGKDGYMCIFSRGKAHKLHRVIFIMHHGFLPNVVDHINGNKLDNRMENLRSASVKENSRNSGTRPTNTSGYKGVYKAMSGKWQACIGVDYKKIYLGVFDTPELAHKVYAEAAKKHHKDFARVV